VERKKVLVIVAHPDDEIIWMGGTLIRYSLKNIWDLTIISLCRKNDIDREPRFRKVCEVLNAEGFISDLEDEKLNKINKKEIIFRIKEFIKNMEYDYVFTHGSNGEYGHIRHKDVHNAVSYMVNKKIISCKKFFNFSYKKIKSRSFNFCECYVKKNADKFINLNEIEFLKKKEIIQNIYGFKKGSFEERNCREIEAFDEK